VTGTRLSRWLADLLGRKAPEPALKPLVQDRFFIYDGQSIAYTLIRRPRKSIGFRITEKGLEVSAPSWVSLKAIEEGLIEKANWIKKHMSRIEGASALRQDRYDYYLEHRKIPLWGQSIRMLRSEKPGLRLIQQADHGSSHDILASARSLDPHQSAVESNEMSSRENLTIESNRGSVLLCHESVSRERLIAWLKREAHRDFDLRIKRFANQLGFGPSSWQLSSAQSRWGSCNSKAVIRLNWRLIHHDPKLIDYVVVHELAHLKELNHSPRYWAIVESVLPDYRERRQLLRHDHDPGTTLLKET